MDDDADNDDDDDDDDDDDRSVDEEEGYQVAHLNKIRLEASENAWQAEATTTDAAGAATVLRARMNVSKQRQQINNTKLTSIISILADKLAVELGVENTSKTMSASEYKKAVICMTIVENQKRFLQASRKHGRRSKHAIHRKRTLLTASAGPNISQNEMMAQFNDLSEVIKVAGRSMVSQSFTIRKKMDERCEELDREHDREITCAQYL